MKQQEPEAPANARATKQQSSDMAKAKGFSCSDRAPKGWVLVIFPCNVDRLNGAGQRGIT
jgi:hypothetical protein